MGLEKLWIVLIVCAALCAVGFYKYVYFLSIGYGLAVAGGAVAIALLFLTGWSRSTSSCWRCSSPTACGCRASCSCAS